MGITAPEVQVFDLFEGLVLPALGCTGKLLLKPTENLAACIALHYGGRV